MVVHVRHATEEDAARIAGIHNQAVLETIATFDTEPRSLPAQIDWLRRHDERHPVFVADAEGEVIGWSSLSPWSDRRAYADTAEVSVYVEPKHQGQGIGRSLLETTVQAAEEAGLHVLLARIADGNPASLALHSRFGFVPVGVMHQVGHKFGRRIDVHQLERVALGRPDAP